MIVRALLLADSFHHLNNVDHDPGELFYLLVLLEILGNYR